MQYRPAPIRVMVACTHQLIDEKQVTIYGVAEDFQGADVVTFACPLCNKTHESRRYG